MTTFYRPRGSQNPAVLWNSETNSAVYEFVAGVFTTEDPELIKKMKKMGFAEEPIEPQTQVALEITADLMRKQPPAPPDHRSVPAHEPVHAQKPKPVEPGILEPKTVHRDPIQPAPVHKETAHKPVEHKPVEKK